MSERLRWARALQAIAQSGLTYTESQYERERYEAVRRIAAEIAATVTGEDPLDLDARFADESGYATPKVDVRGVVVDAAGRVALVREPGQEGWTLPGGWADVGETPRAAVEKEVREEAGLEARAIRLLAVLDRDIRGRLRWPAHVYKLYVLCEPVSETAQPAPDGHETVDAGWFAFDALPPLSFKTPEPHMELVAALVADPTLPAALD